VGGYVQFQTQTQRLASDPLAPGSIVCCVRRPAGMLMREGPHSVVLHLGAFQALVADDLLEQQP
jgi:hypothetical protein